MRAQLHAIHHSDKLLTPITRRYMPSFKSAIDHFCIHAGGRAVLDGIEKNLRLDPSNMLPSRTVLHERDR